jgi:hypothetical protein
MWLVWVKLPTISDTTVTTVTAQPITNRWTPNSKLVLITCPRPDEPIAGLSTSVMAVRRYDPSTPGSFHPSWPTAITASIRLDTFNAFRMAVT